jgi:antitoxin MazE
MTRISAHIIQIGNSQGIRIPKKLLEQCNLRSHVELEPKDNKLIIYSLDTPRHGWGEMFHKMAEAGDDAPVGHL